MAVLPLEPHLCSDDHFIAVARGGHRLAHDLLCAPKAIDRGGVNQVDALIEGGVNRADRLLVVGATPHPAAPIAQVPRPTGVIKSVSRDQAAFCSMVAQYCSHCPLARSVRKASMSAAVSSFHQAPASFKRC